MSGDLYYNAMNVGIGIYFGCILSIHSILLKHKTYRGLKDTTLVLVIGIIIATFTPNNVALFTMAVLGNVVMLAYHYILNMRGNPNRTQKELKTMHLCISIPIVLQGLSIIYRIVIVGDSFDFMTFIGLVLLTVFIVVIKYNERRKYS